MGNLLSTKNQTSNLGIQFLGRIADIQLGNHLYGLPANLLFQWPPYLSEHEGIMCSYDGGRIDITNPSKYTTRLHIASPLLRKHNEAIFPEWMTIELLQYIPVSGIVTIIKEFIIFKVLLEEPEARSLQLVDYIFGSTVDEKATPSMSAPEMEFVISFLSDREEIRLLIDEVQTSISLMTQVLHEMTICMDTHCIVTTDWAIIPENCNFDNPHQKYGVICVRSRSCFMVSSRKIVFECRCSRFSGGFLVPEWFPELDRHSSSEASSSGSRGSYGRSDCHNRMEARNFVSLVALIHKYFNSQR